MLDTIDPPRLGPANPKYSERSRLAKTMRKDGTTWGAVPAERARTWRTPTPR